MRKAADEAESLDSWLRHLGDSQDSLGDKTRGTRLI